jgi:FkbM family methyltransferase
MVEVVTIPRVNGYSLNKINRDLSEFIEQNGFFVSKHRPKGFALIQHYSSPLKKHYDFTNKILIQPIDGTTVNKNHIDIINSYDIIITPSIIGKRIMLDNGVLKPIYVIPNYYDDDIKPNDYFKKSDKFTFYSESTGIKRKNIENLLKYFLETFTKSDNVRLVIKTNSDRVDELNSVLSQYTDKPEVVIIGKYLSDEDLESIMCNIDCYICLSYMEGFCIPIINALKWNKKVIALDTEISGYGDFLTHDNAYLVKCNRIPIDKKFESLLIWGEDSEWEEADYEDYKNKLRSVITDNSKRGVDIKRYAKSSILSEYLFILTEKVNPFNFGNFYLPNDDGSRWMLDNKFHGWEDFIDREIIKLSKDMNVIDVGAHVGYITVKLAKWFSKGKVFSFEPSDLSYRYLLKNIDANNLVNVKTYNYAVGDREAEVGLTNDNNLFLNEVVENGTGVTLIKLDSISLPKIGLIKLDVEGFELRVLSGAANLISKDKPSIIMEIHERNYDEYAPFIINLNYELVKLNHNNYLCLPKNN